MSDFLQRVRLSIAPRLLNFIEEKVILGTAFSLSISGRHSYDLTPLNRAFLSKRDELHTQLNAWQREHPGPLLNKAEYRTFRC